MPRTYGIASQHIYANIQSRKPFLNQFIRTTKSYWNSFINILNFLRVLKIQENVNTHVYICQYYYILICNIISMKSCDFIRLNFHLLKKSI